MQHQEWPANAYAIGSYIQSTVAEQYLPRFRPNPDDCILDVGCGNGAFTKHILAKVPQGQVLGVDPSEQMLQLAHEVSKEYPNFSIQTANVLDMNFKEPFDYIVSFWCLQWASKDIKTAFTNILRALKPAGKLLALFPSGDDAYITSYYAIKQSGVFSSLNHFQPPIDYSRFATLADDLTNLPFSKLNVEKCTHKIVLPSLDIFRKFVNGIAFYQGQVADEDIAQINEAMVNHYNAQCQSQYQGEYQFNFNVYLVTGER